jgi:hypothetical protein
MMQRSSYLGLAKVLTAESEKIVTSVDYVTDQCINERVQVMQVIINDLVAPADKKELTLHLTLVQNFLKYQYDDHAKRRDGVCSHGLKYGLMLPDDNEDEEKTDTKSCKGCLYVEYFMKKMLPDAVEGARTESNTGSVSSAIHHIKDSLHCFHRFQGHRVRVCNQQEAIAELNKTILNEVNITKQRGCSATVTIDWKMKYNEERTRESQIHNYGKRGISWHEAVLQYYDWDDQGNKPVRIQVSLDQILATGNRQDGMAVLADLEALLKKIEVELPFLKHINIVSDNAGCYHKKELILSVPILNAMSKSVKIVRIVHTETQDGKGPCDSHGAIAHRHVKRNFLLTREEKTENKVVATPKSLATAIACKGGLQNNGEFLLLTSRTL